MQIKRSNKPVKYYHLDSINLYSWSRRIAEKYNTPQLREKVMVIEGIMKLH